MNKLTITTIRHKLSKEKLDEIMLQYQSDKNLLKRIDIDRLAKNKFSRKVVQEKGYKIETIVFIEKE